MPFDYADVDNRRDVLCDWGPLGKKIAHVRSSTEATCESPVNYHMNAEAHVRLTLNN